MNPGGGTLIPRAPDVDAVLPKLDLDPPVVESAPGQDALGAAERVVDYEQLGRLDGEIAELDPLDFDHRHFLRAGHAAQQDRARTRKRQAKSLRGFRA